MNNIRIYAEIKAAIEIAKKNAANDYNFNKIIEVLQPCADDLKAGINAKEALTRGGGVAAMQKLCANIIKSVDNNRPALKGVTTLNGFDYVCNGFVIIKAPAGLLPLPKIAEGLVPVDFEKILPANDNRVIDFSQFPKAAELRAALKLIKAGYDAKTRKANNGIVYHFAGLRAFNAETLEGVLTALEAAEAAGDYTVYKYEKPFTMARFTAGGFEMGLMPAHSKQETNEPGFYWGNGARIEF